ncbi:unnamed protein product, partial [marine sediment metagenome]
MIFLPAIVRQTPYKRTAQDRDYGKGNIPENVLEENKLKFDRVFIS